MPPAPDRLGYLFDATRRALVATGRPPALVETFGTYQAHAEAVVALAPAVRELMVHRRMRDRALARGLSARAQKAGARLAEAEIVISGLIELLAQDPVPPAPARAASRAEIRQGCAERRARVAELAEQGLSQSEIAAAVGCHPSVVAADLTTIRKANAPTAPVRTRARPQASVPPC